MLAILSTAAMWLTFLLLKHLKALDSKLQVQFQLSLEIQPQFQPCISEKQGIARWGVKVKHKQTNPVVVRGKHVLQRRFCG
jgi:hypothetical protein